MSLYKIPRAKLSILLLHLALFDKLENRPD